MRPLRSRTRDCGLNRLVSETSPLWPSAWRIVRRDDTFSTHQLGSSAGPRGNLGVRRLDDSNDGTNDMGGTGAAAARQQPNRGGGAAATGGAGGSGPKVGIDIDETPGEAISAPDMKWTFIPIEGAKCRDGSDTGIGVSFNPSSKNLMIFMQGGGACFNSQSCLGTAKKDTIKRTGWSGPGDDGLMDRANAQNPVKDWNFVFIPYCTGDVHAGFNEASKADGAGKNNRRVGYANVRLAMKRLIGPLTDLDRVLLAGTGAGGFGAAADYFQEQRMFGDTPMDMLDDSGPPMTSQYAPVREIMNDAWDPTAPSWRTAAALAATARTF